MYRCPRHGVQVPLPRFLGDGTPTTYHCPVCLTALLEGRRPKPQRVTVCVELEMKDRP